MFNNVYKDRKVLLTGHTGFKGSWMAAWLQVLGAEVVGVSLEPSTTPSHWQSLKLDMESHLIDIRNDNELHALVEKSNPDIIFHLAAQPLVRESYHDPLGTWNTNVVGTANLLNSIRTLGRLSGAVIITTDKCYENREWEWGYREIDPLGGSDPYSASKAATELVVSSFRDSFFGDPGNPLLVTARAGNVIGGGDWSVDRLIPDYIRSLENGLPLELRSPMSTRPWQHVLDCLSGYLLLGQKIIQRDPTIVGAWNFGPDIISNKTVVEILDSFKIFFPKTDLRFQEERVLKEAQLLYLDSSKAKKRLAWESTLNYDNTIEMTADWYLHWLNEKHIITFDQLAKYQSLAAIGKIPWALNN